MDSDSTKGNPEETSADKKGYGGGGPQVVPDQEYAQERAQFRALLLSNPNYFGNVEESPFQPVLNLQLNTRYEEIGSVGYQPQLRRLEAVIFVKQPFGYGGGICSNGTQEFVRFYLSFDNGATWQDQGLSSFHAYDIPEGKSRLEYAVTRRINPPRKFCKQGNVILARAILSWNTLPPPNNPNFRPVWGDVHNTHIQVEPYKKNLITATEDMPLDVLAKSIEQSETMEVAKPKPLGAVELQALYKGKDVEPHRYALADVQKLVDTPTLTEAMMSPGYKGVLSELNINLADLIGKFFPVDGSTRYEELECVGLNTKEDMLVGVIRVKLSSGYSGNLCSPGSKEYVTFWADFDGNGSFETCLGTASVNVHDINEVPREGLEYAVSLPVNLDKYRQPCKKGPKVVRIRAILSWQVAPPCNNPNYIPIWGNREETQIHIMPGDNPGDQIVPVLTAVGDIAKNDIDGNGLIQNAVAIHTGASFDDAPFGGRITLAGKILNGTSATKYRIMRKLHGALPSSYVPLTNDPLDLVINTGPFQTHTTITPDADGYYDYQDYPPHFVESNILGVWFSTVNEDGKTYDVRVDVKVDANPLNDLHSNVVTVMIDNKKPDIDLTIDLGVGGQCADFNSGVVFTGAYKAVDEHFGGFSFVIRPGGPAHGVLPDPPAGSHGIIAPPGLSLIPDPGVASGTYTLNTGVNPNGTGPMDPCGYSLTLQVSDRTNVNSGQTNNHDERSVGFCIRKKQ